MVVADNENSDMSDNWIALIPEDPRFMPEAEAQDRARQRFAQIAPDAQEIEAKDCGKIEFFDCGSNFERILCPSCHSEVPDAWWQARMDEDYSDGFQLTKYAMPCCGRPQTLDELVYEWQQGFARFVLEAMNPNSGELEAGHKSEIENILGTKLRVIYQHI